MATVHGRVTGGQIVPRTPVDWPDGTEVRIESVEDDVGIGMREEDWPTTPEGIADLIAQIDALEPVMTPEEEARWRAALAEQKAWELANWDKWNRDIDAIFQ